MTDRRLKVALLADANHVNTRRWCEGLTYAGADIDLITFAGELPGLHGMHRLGVPPLLGKLHYLAAVPATRRLLARLRPDVLMAYYATGFGTLGALSGFHPLVIVTAGSDVLMTAHRPLVRRLLRFNLARADLVTAWAGHMAEAAVAGGASRGGIFVLPRGIPVDDFAPHACRPPRAGEPVQVISTRGLHRAYRIDVLIRAVADARSNGTALQLTVAGRGPAQEELARLACDLGVADHVTFTGFVPNERLPELLSRHHVYAAAIETDGVSASLLEAMAVGLLPVVPDIPANRDWITSGVNGLLTKEQTGPGLSSALKDAALWLWRNAPLWQDANTRMVRHRADFLRNSTLYVERLRKLLQSQAQSESR